MRYRTAAWLFLFLSSAGVRLEAHPNPNDLEARRALVTRCLARMGGLQAERWNALTQMEIDLDKPAAACLPVPNESCEAMVAGVKADLEKLVAGIGINDSHKDNLLYAVGKHLDHMSLRSINAVKSIARVIGILSQRPATNATVQAFELANRVLRGRATVSEWLDLVLVQYPEAVPPYSEGDDPDVVFFYGDHHHIPVLSWPLGER